MSRVILRVHWSVTNTGRGADDIENTASSIVACWAVFTELLPGNALIKSVALGLKLEVVFGSSGFLLWSLLLVDKSQVDAT
jgi:hypothetical protein